MDREISWQELVRRSDAGKFAREDAERLIEEAEEDEDEKREGNGN